MEHWALSLPEVDATLESAHGPLSDDEQRQLIEAHKAVDNARTARWMLGFSLEVVRRRRLYRGDGTRTWEQYLAQEHDGLSTSEADRLQKTWRLAQAVQKELGRPAPDSHMRKLEPYAQRTSDEQAAAAYKALYWAHQEQGHRLVAKQVQQRVSKAVEAAKGVSDPIERTRAVTAAWAVTPDEPVPAQRTDKGRSEAPASATDPIDAALRLLHAAREAIEGAAENKRAREGRSEDHARFQQEAIRRIGRVLAKVKVEGEFIPDAEIVG
ncbi:hypothetical protein ACFWRZ_37330 [Streptomyces rubiginosohelvolus]|uniref:hypothetical protein n=1 Tax=Streptomyces rubiginosohelvolus TaxID=67362 RepID=UPI00364BF745